MRDKRRGRRKYPRSRLQLQLDAAEDAFTSLRTLSLAGAGSCRVSSRLYDMTNLTCLSLRGNGLQRLSSSLQYLVRLTSLDVSDNALLTLPRALQVRPHAYPNPNPTSSPLL